MLPFDCLLPPSEAGVAQTEVSVTFGYDGIPFVFTYFGQERLAFYGIPDDKPLPPIKRVAADMSPEALTSASKLAASSLPLTKVPGGGSDPKLAVLKEQAVNSASLAASNASLAVVAQSKLKLEADQRLVDSLAEDISELTSEIKDLPSGDPSLPAMEKELADLKAQRVAAKKQRIDGCKGLSSCPR